MAERVRHVLTLRQQALELEAEEKVNWRLPAGKLSPIHFRAIQRIYGATPGAAPRPRPPPAPPALP